MVGQRYYSPELCRFIQPSNVSSLNPSSINGLNLYSYANNNPIGITYDGSSVRGGIVGTNGKLLDNNSVTDEFVSLNRPTLCETLGFASNVYAILNGVKVVKYLTYIHGNPPKISWFLDNLSKHGKISGYLGYAASVADGIGVYINTNDIGKAGWTITYDIGGMLIASELGGLIAGLVGGPAGAIVGTLAGIGIEALIQWFKEDVVNMVDNIVDDFIEWIVDR